MRGFLEALGLRRRVESTRGGWVEMVAESGMVALHSARDSESQAPSGFTSLSFEADDSTRWRSGCGTPTSPDVVVYDEAYGRVLDCLDPLGDHLQIDEHSDDLYGYRLHQPPEWRAGPAGSCRCVSPTPRRVRRLPEAARLRAARGRSASTSPPSPSARAATAWSASTRPWIQRVSAPARAVGQSRRCVPLLRDHGGAEPGRGAAGAAGFPASVADRAPWATSSRSRTPTGCGSRCT